MTFRVGMKVECVADPVIKNGNPIQPVIGRIYTVRACFISDQGIPSIRLAEFLAPIHVSGVEFGFWASRFRPLIESKKRVSFTMGADPDSEKFDNRKNIKVKA